MVFEQRRVGTTDLTVSTLGLGAASLAGNMSPVSESDARATIANALDAGITYVDTAPFYGYGKSERLVGDEIRSRIEATVLSTKCGRLLAPHAGPYDPPTSWQDPLPFVDVFNYTYDGIMRSFEDSQQRLGLTAIEILYVHDIGVVTHGVERNAELWDQLANQGGYDALRKLRESGAIKAIGMGVNEWEVLMSALDLGDWDVFLLAGRYTLLDQTSLSPLLETCLARKTSVVCGGPFNSGILVGGDTWNYERAPTEVIERAKGLQRVCQSHGVDLPAAALQFPLAHPALISVIPGPRTPTELEQILAWWNVKIPDSLWTDMQSEGLLAEGTPIPGTA